jgi:2',3'-cyclic-nucleotide 2'-phosphodiesterase (5'-nucleotidase family)
LDTANEKVSATNADTLSAIALYLQPLRDSLSQVMDEKISEAKGTFTKAKPGGSLGNFIADVMFGKAQQKQAQTLGVMYNYGGIRLNQIPEGPISKGKIYELLPFDNELVLISIKGSVLKVWLQSAIKSGGWPISRGLAFTIDSIGHMAFNSGLSIDDSIDYYIATNDYVANGGDDCSFLKGIPQIHTGMLTRDVMIEYLRMTPQVMPDTLQRILWKNEIKK